MENFLGRTQYNIHTTICASRRVNGVYPPTRSTIDALERVFSLFFFECGCLGLRIT